MLTPTLRMAREQSVAELPVAAPAVLTRRRILGFAMGVAATAAIAQPVTAGRVYRLGILRPTPGPTRADQFSVESLLPRALRSLGYVQGSNLIIETRYADGRLDRLPALARELVRQKMDCIVVVTATAVQAMKAETSVIPVVMWGNFDPVALKFVTSLARPGGNTTGVLIASEGTLAVKKLELLKLAVPGARRIGVLAPPDVNVMRMQMPELVRGARALGMELAVVEVQENHYERAFATMTARKPEALFVAATSYFMFDRQPIVELAIHHRLPSMWEWREQVEAGGLMAYGSSLAQRVGTIADYVDRILKGANAGELPIDQPTTFELAVNMRTARAIGLVLPREFLLRADEVIH